MAKLLTPNGIGGERTPALGPGYRVSTWRGVVRITAKPTKKKKRISKRQRETMEEFRQLANVAKAITVTEYEAALRMAHGTQYLWRDLLYMTQAGRLFWFQDTSGHKWFSMAARTSISDVLEAISQRPGCILIRGENWWDVVEPGPPGSVLSMPSVGNLPVWSPGGGGSGSHTLLAYRTTDDANSASYPRYVPFQTTSLADWPGWSAGTPERVGLPAAATRFRVSAQIIMTSRNSAENVVLRINDYDNNASLPVFSVSALGHTNQSFPNQTYQIIAPWQARGSVDSVAVNINRPFTPNDAFLAQCWISVEVDAV